MTVPSDLPDLLSVIPFARTLGMSVKRDEPDQVLVSLAWHERLCTSGGVLHGGVIMSLADTAGAICAFRNLPAEAVGTTTVESKTNFLRAVTRGHVEALAKPVHAGRTLIVVETDVRDDQDRLVARVSQTQVVLTAS